MDRDEKDREEKSVVHGMLPDRVDVSDAILIEKGKSGSEIDKLAFELYKETAGIIIACASSLVATEEPSEFKFDRNQAICVGLLVRIVKFMRATLAILSHGDELGEVILAHLRCIGESAINLRYLILKNDNSLFDQFVKVSLGPERELYDIIKRNISKRGEELPVEKRMLASTERICKISGFKIEEIDPKHKEWGGSMRERLKALGIEDAYVAVQRIPSHAIHGTWVDLILHHLEEKRGGFVTNFDDMPVDSRLLAPICRFVLQAVADYLNRFIGDIPETRPLHARVKDLDERLGKVDKAHEEWYHQNKKVEPGAPPGKAKEDR